jgi:hypothetical protein
MTDPIRQASSHIVIAVCACVGASALVIAPMRRESAQIDDLIQERVREAEAHRRQAEVQGGLIRVAGRARALGAQIDARSALGADEGRIYAELVRMAAARGVRLQQVDPKRSVLKTEPCEPANPGQPPVPAAPRADWRVRCTITVSGSFDAVTRFIDDFNRADWFAEVASALIVPGDEPGDSVVASLTTLHYAFDTSPLADAKPEGQP